MIKTWFCYQAPNPGRNNGFLFFSVLFPFKLCPLFFTLSGEELFLTWYCCVGTCQGSDKRSSGAALIQISACSQWMGAGKGSEIQHDNLSAELKRRVLHTPLHSMSGVFCRISFILILPAKQIKSEGSERPLRFYFFKIIWIKLAFNPITHAAQSVGGHRLHLYKYDFSIFIFSWMWAIEKKKKIWLLNVFRKSKYALRCGC